MSTIDAALQSGGTAVRERLSALALSMAALFWSGNYVAGRYLRDHLDALTLNAARWTLALVLILPFVWPELRASMPALRRHWRLVLGLGATGIASFHTLSYSALQSTTAVNALLILSLTPTAILIAGVLSGRERPTARQIVGVLISTAGAVVLVTRGDPAVLLQRSFNIGDLWMLAAVAVWAVYSLLLRARPAALSQSVTLTASIGAGLALLAPFWLLTASTPLAALATTSTALAIIYIAVFASAIAFPLWSYGVTHLGATRSGQFIHLMPVFGAVLAFGVLGETLKAPQIVGGALAIMGVIWVERRT